jgi:phosphopantothenoylcysteine decarboxylase
MNILLGVTGSVAACLTPKLVRALAELGNVHVVFTDKGSNMLVLPIPGEWSNSVDWFCDADEWSKDWQKGDPVLHIDLKNWADILVIAPCSANTLAKMANGLADNLLTCVVRAWPVWKPLFVAPAMNTDMWEKPVTHRHTATLCDDFKSCTVIKPQTKVLACGDEGVGAMAEISTIVATIREQSAWWNPLWPRQLFIPKAPHPGSFGAVRRHDIHTGVDLYTQDGAEVFAVETGVIVDIVDFTGSKVTDKDGKPMSWWNDTKAVLIKGLSGVVVYGEIEPLQYLKVGSKVSLGQPIGQVKAVLPPNKIRLDIPHHSTAMLHIELYESIAAEAEFRWDLWPVGGEKPNGLLDPTPYLKDLKK